MTYKQTYIVISKSSPAHATLGPFETHETAVKWAEGVSWVDGYVVRALWPVDTTKGP